MVTTMSLYAPLNVRVATPRLELVGATDELLEALAPLVAAGKATADPPPWDDPNSSTSQTPTRELRSGCRVCGAHAALSDRTCGASTSLSSSTTNQSANKT